MKARNLLLIALVVTGGIPNAGGRQQAGYRDVAKLLLDDGEARDDAKETLLASKDTTLLAALNDVLVFFHVIERHREVREVADMMTEIAGDKVPRNRMGSVKWIGRHEEIQPKPGYLDFKASLFAHYDPNFRRFLDPSYRFLIRPEEIVWGGVTKDGIPALTNPGHVPASDAEYLRGSDRVFGVFIHGEARAYPHRIMGWHEMANDVVGGVPVSLSYCTLCGSGILYDGRVDGTTYTFGSSGLLYRSNKLMYDHQSESLWSNLTAEPVSGQLVDSGYKLKMLPVVVTTWQTWRELHPETKVLDVDTGYERDYEQGPHDDDYFRSKDTMFPVWLESDRLETKEWIFALIVNGRPKAYPLDVLKKKGIVHDRLGGKDLVLIADRRTRAVRAFEAGGRRFWKAKVEGQLIETTSRTPWKLTEEFLVDESGTKTLARLPGHNAYWFGWYAFYPSTEVYEP